MKIKLIQTSVVLQLCLLMAVTELQAADFYVDPINGSTNGDGSFNDPWRTLEEVLTSGMVETRNWQDFPPQNDTLLETVNAGAPIQSGDTLWLRSGYHGSFSIRGAYNAAPITVAAAPGHRPLVSHVDIKSAQHWHLKGLEISPSFASSSVDEGNIVAVADHNFFGPAYDVVVEDSHIYTIDDATGWGASEWINQTKSGVRVSADRVSIIGNKIRNVRFGMTVTGNQALLSRNIIDGFSADGIRGLGNGNVFEYNRVQNCYVSSGQGDGNHDDGFQSWSVGANGVGTGEVRDVVLRGNTFINFTDPSNPLNAPMQGIGCFDGNFVNWVVENNVVITNHWHGISFYGMIDSRIVNNSLLDLNDENPGPPWIRVTASSQSESQNVVVKNNLSPTFSLSGVNITDDHNISINSSNVDQIYMNPPYQLMLKPGSPAIDAGDAANAPDVDVTGYPRPQGNAIDLGAFEFRGDLIFSDGFDSN